MPRDNTKLYTKGRNAEYYVMEKLRKLGATLVFRSAGSKSPADIIAIFPKKKEIWLVQVKSSKIGLMVVKVMKEYQELADLDGKYEVRGGVFVKTKHGWANSFEG